MLVQEIHHPIDVAVLAVELADLRGNDGHLLEDADQGRVPAGLVLTAESVAVAVPTGGELVERIVWLELQPLIELRAPVLASQDDDVGGAGATDGVHHLLHTGDGEARATTVAAVAPAAPGRGGTATTVGVGLVVRLEQHGAVALEAVGDRRPERGAMVAIGHHLLTGGQLTTWGIEVQIDDRGDVVAGQDVDVIRHRVLVNGARWIGAIDA